MGRQKGKRSGLKFFFSKDKKKTLNPRNEKENK